MKPAWSVILFTTLAGAGQGLFLALAAAEFFSDPQAVFLQSGALIVLALLAGGLLASFFHLGRPGRAWRAAAMWRTSWLSRSWLAISAREKPDGPRGKRTLTAPLPSANENPTGL